MNFAKGSFNVVGVLKLSYSDIELFVRQIQDIIFLDIYVTCKVLTILALFY